MPRAPFQILVIPYRQAAGGCYEYLLFSRSDYECRQWIAGGGEDDETPLQAARREMQEEAGIKGEPRVVQLDTIASIPVTHFDDGGAWPRDLFVIPEHAFGVDASNAIITLSHEHTECRWLGYEQALQILTYDSNRTALWELHQRLLGKRPRD